MAERMSKFWRSVLLYGRGMEEKEKAAAIAAYIRNLQHFFEPRGFTFARRYQAFRRRDGDLTFSFAPNHGVYGDVFAIKPAAGITHDAIEDIFHQVSVPPETAQCGPCTVPWTWAKRKPKRNSFMVGRPSQVAAAVGFTTRFFARWVEPFFREHSSLVAISDSFNDGRAVLRTKKLRFDLLGRALVAAKLSKRGDYETLKTEYLRALQKGHYSYSLTCFDELTQILDE